MKGKATFILLATVTLLCLASATVVWGAGNPSGGKVYALEEISIQDCPEPARSRLQMGQYAAESGDSPLPGITYPTFKSNKPTYGAVTFDMSLFDPQAGIRYCFAMDESAGTGTGYDRLYFDLNHDSDLTNDSAVVRVQDTPTGMPAGQGMVFFADIRVGLDYGPDGVWTQTMTPRMMNVGNSGRMFLAAPTARKGKIVLGSEEVELVLAQYGTITGRYDKPMTGVFLTGKEELLPFLAYWRCVNGTFYKLLPTPAGDRIRVEPYAGPSGVFEVGAGSRNIAQPGVELGWLQSKDAIIDLLTCTGADGKANVPVGDYRPLRLAVRYGTRRVGLSADTSQIGQKAAPPAVFPFKVRQEKPLVLDFSGKPDMVFKSPTADRLKTGETLKVEAVLYLPGTDIMISGVEDMTKKSGSTKLPDGREFNMYESVAPTIKIANSSGQTVAEGEMPFG
jgi:hypothetical protein